MSATAEDVLREALQLPERERARVAAETWQVSIPTSKPGMERPGSPKWSAAHSRRSAVFLG